MNYELLMQIGLTINDKKRGQVIIGGADPKFSFDNTKGLNIVDKYIMVKTTTEELRFKVKKLDISTSIAEKLNIGIIIYDSDDFIKIKAGDEVYRVLS
jgi:hypothetical protein